MTASKRIKVLIAEDKEVVRLGLKKLVGGIEGCKVVGEAKTGVSAVKMTDELRPDVVLMKKNLQLFDGINASLQIKKRSPSTAVILLLSQESDFWSAIDSGANGYIMRETPEHLLSVAIRTVHHGGSWIGPVISHYILHGGGLPLLRRVLAERKEMPSLQSLTRREKEVLLLLTDGLSNQAIAESLDLQIQTVKTHMRSIFKKLNVEGRAEAMAKVLRTGSAI